MLLKNTAGQKWIVFAFDRTTNAAKTGDAANITANLRIDGGAANPIDDINPTELETGYYVFDLTAAETNGNMIVICPVSATSNIQVIGVPGTVWTASNIADAVWDELLTGHTTAGTAGELLNHTNTTGSGAVTWAYTVTDASTAAPIDGAEVWVSTDIGGADIIASGITNASGTVTFYLDAGNYYFWTKKSGYNFTNPDLEAVA